MCDITFIIATTLIDVTDRKNLTSNTWYYGNMGSRWHNIYNFNGRRRDTLFFSRVEYDYIFYTSFLRVSKRDCCKKKTDFTAR